MGNPTTTSTQQTLQEQWAEVCHHLPWAPAFLQGIEEQGGRLCWALMLPSGLAAVRVQTPDDILRRFELAPELLFLLASGHLQAQHVRGGIPRAASPSRSRRVGS